MIKGLLLAVLCCAGVAAGASAQNIRSHYVSKAEQDGTIYHTFPCTLFENREAGELTFDITYKEHGDGCATINFTCEAERPTAIDSVCFAAGSTLLAGPATKIYMEPYRRRWKLRYSFRVPVRLVGAFFDERAEASATLYAGPEMIVYRVKRSAWRSYAPIGYTIFEMIRVNE